VLTLRYVLKHQVGCLLDPQVSSAAAGVLIIDSAMQVARQPQQPMVGKVSIAVAMEALEAQRRPKSQTTTMAARTRAKTAPRPQARSCSPRPCPVQPRRAAETDASGGDEDHPNAYQDRSTAASETGSRSNMATTHKEAILVAKYAEIMLKVSGAFAAAVTSLPAGDVDLALLGDTLTELATLAEECGQAAQSALGRFQEVYQWLKRARLENILKTQVKDESERRLREEMPKNWHKLEEARCVVLVGTKGPSSVE